MLMILSINPLDKYAFIALLSRLSRLLSWQFSIASSRVAKAINL